MHASSAQERPFARSALDYMLSKAISARLVIAPLLGSLALTFAFFESTAWRKQLLSTGVGLIFTLSVVEWLRYRRFGLSVVQLPVNVLVTVFAQLLVITASGGVFSPAVPIIVMMTLVTALLGARKTVIALLAMAAPWLWVLALVHRRSWPVGSLLPTLFGGEQPIEHGPAPFVAAATYTLLLATAARVGTALQALFERLFDDAMRERDRTLELLTEQGRVLTLLTSEIGHELKNPLASLKGLSALVAKDVEGRTAERMRVLRGEVDRMQAILEEFLTLSRPLVPLSVTRTDLRELVRDVLRLYEGHAGERGVTLELEAADEALLRCDSRKVRQVLINLFQNALEASPRASTVTVRVSRTAERMSVSVSDRGPGLAPEVEGRVFEPFVTSKEEGSGIGLVVARSLARQHGGEVRLSPRSDGRGLTAELQLPFEPPGVQP
jgi:two-component system sensor histidine kinase HydH